MHILETFLEKIRKVFMKAALCLERKLHNNNNIFRNAALSTSSIYIVRDIIYYGIAVKLRMSE